jgi:hypothetical protein
MNEMDSLNIAHSNGARAFAVLGQFLQQDGWLPQQVGDRSIYRVSFSDRNRQMACYAQVRTEVEQFAFYVIAPIQVPESARPAVAEFLTRVNYGLWIGNFEMDWRDGEVRYKSSLDFEGVTLTPQLIRNAIDPAVRTMSCYLPGLERIVQEGKSSEEALTHIMQALSECENCQ